MKKESLLIDILNKGWFATFAGAAGAYYTITTGRPEIAVDLLSAGLYIYLVKEDINEYKKLKNK